MAMADAEMRSKCGVAVKSPKSSAIERDVGELTMYVFPYNQDNRHACSSAITPHINHGNDAWARRVAGHHSIAPPRNESGHATRFGNAAGRARGTRRLAAHRPGPARRPRRR